jgi:hypothetical protein
MELNKNLDTVEELKLQEEFKKHQEFIINLEPESLLERLIKALDSTEVILEGYNLVTNINEGHGIAVAGIIRLREALAEAIDWIDTNVNDVVLEIDEESYQESYEEGDEL